MDRSSLHTLLAPVVATLRLEIDHIEVLRVSGREVVRVFLDGDGPEGHGPDLDQIAAATKAISHELDEADTGQQPFVLEVSTRGVDAPLQTPAHFRRNISRLVRVTLKSGDVETARITAVTDDGVELTPDEGDAKAKVVPFDAIASAKVQIEFRDKPGAGDVAAEEE
ncbi:MAG: ribosome maturation factor RimP [Propionibacteriaceae bacterium]|nr:ribosome maturation factor RimP [Propionibacteriaceae bacterium]